MREAVAFTPNYLRNKGKSFDKDGKPKKSTREEERSVLKISVKEVEKSLGKTAKRVGRPKGSKNRISKGKPVLSGVRKRGRLSGARLSSQESPITVGGNEP